MIIFGVFTQVISNYFVRDLKDELIQEACSIGNAYMDTLIVDPTYDNLNAQSYLKYKFQFLNDNLGTHTVIIDNNHTVLLASEETYSDTFNHLLNSKMIEGALKGKVEINTGTTKSGGEDLAISVAVPMIRSEIIYGVVFMHTAYPKINKDIDYIYKITFVTLIAVLVLAFAFAYIYSNQTKRSLDAMIKTSKDVASGNFASRIAPPYSNDFAELAKNMNSMAEDLGKLEEMRKDFIANISHDFRSPLTSIKGFVQAILDGTIPYENQNKYLNIVLEESERLTRLTNNILLLTKIENHQVTLEKTNFDVHSILRKVILQFEQPILKKQLEIKLLVSKKELFVFADLNQIQRVLYNIIDNAVKFCQDNDEIIIDTQIIKDKVQVSISDTGLGISEEQIHYIWNRFHKADRSRGKDKKGTGIGLSIVREIIKAHDEQIDVYSQEGKGSTFFFTLPLSNKNKN